MDITYIYHSGFAVEMSTCILVFDYWQDPAEVMEPLLRSSKPLYVFASHFHEDHFTPAIFEWKKRREGITYILSKDILRHRRAQTNDADVWLAKGGTWADELIRVWATGSTDSGVSWIVETPQARLFHAGDLGNWYARFLTASSLLAERPADMQGRPADMQGRPADMQGRSIDPEKEEKRYLGELKDIAKIASHFDVAFLPVDARIGNGYTRGARQFADRFSIGLLVPMHFSASSFASAWRIRPTAAPVWKIMHNGEKCSIPISTT